MGEVLVTGEIYHLFNRSIAEYMIFNDNSDFSRFIEVMRYYQNESKQPSFSHFNQIQDSLIKSSKNALVTTRDRKLVEIIAYCIMPTHIHLILKQAKEKGISIFIGNILNSYSRYFNIKHKRKGPLWEGRFRRILVESDEYLLHLTRYLHLNPVTAHLVNTPEKWLHSSYQEYLSNSSIDSRLCKYDDVLDIRPVSYKEFVEDRIAYQRELAKIKDLLLE